MKIELLYFDGCPSHEALLPRLRRVLGRRGVDEPIELRRIESLEQAEGERFLGSPTLRIDGRDVDPGAAPRRDFGLKCRLYRTDHGLQGAPPDEWIVTALDGASPGARALRAIGIAPQPLADDRLAGLADRDRRNHRAIVERLAAGERPDGPWLTSIGCDRDARARLASSDLVRIDDDGGVALAYPFSVAPTRHRVDLDDGRRLWACCAIDALAIPAVVGVEGTVVADSPVCDDEIRVEVGPAGDPVPDPAEAVVLVGAVGNGATACCACPFINFFASSARAGAYQARHPELTSTELSIRDAATAGRRLFGGVLA